MKTIRQNVFETNSSSTHSVTISRRSTPKTEKVTQPLVDKGTLYPKRLAQYGVSVGYDGSQTTCDTKDKKAAIVMHWIHGFNRDGEIEEFDFNNYRKMITEACGYLSIDFEGMTWADYNPYGEYDDGGFRLNGNTEEDLETINEAIKNILDDDIIITDADLPY